jgi:hypothetical protein
MICLLVRDHLNFAQVEALNIDGFEDDSKLIQSPDLPRSHEPQPGAMSIDDFLDCRPRTAL